MSAKLESAGGHGHQGTWFDSAYAEKEAPGSELRHFQQKIDCVVRIRRTRDFSQGVQTLGHGGEGEEPSAAVIMQWPLAQWVTRQCERTPRLVPDSEGVDADQMIEAVLRPALPCGQEDRGVAQPPRLFGRNIQGGLEFLAVIKTQIRSQHQAPPRALERLAIVHVFGQEPVQTAAERGVTSIPLVAGVRTVHALGSQHPPTRRPWVWLTSARQESGNCRHSRRMSRTVHRHQALGLELGQKVDHIALASIGVDVVLGGKTRAQFHKGGRRVDKLKYAQPDTVKTVAHALGGAESHGLAIHLGKDQVAAAPNPIGRFQSINNHASGQRSLYG